MYDPEATTCGSVLKVTTVPTHRNNQRRMVIESQDEIWGVLLGRTSTLQVSKASSTEMRALASDRLRSAAQGDSSGSSSSGLPNSCRLRSLQSQARPASEPARVALSGACLHWLQEPSHTQHAGRAVLGIATALALWRRADQ